MFPQCPKGPVRDLQFANPDRAILFPTSREFVIQRCFWFSNNSCIKLLFVTLLDCLWITWMNRSWPLLKKCLIVPNVVFHGCSATIGQVIYTHWKDLWTFGLVRIRLFNCSEVVYSSSFSLKLLLSSLSWQGVIQIQGLCVVQGNAWCYVLSCTYLGDNTYQKLRGTAFAHIM